MLEPWIETHSGKRMYFLDPKPDMVDIYDIAHSLSNQCRFSGHTNRFYSVAEHSFRVAHELRLQGFKPDVMLQGLLHDASEAYLLDVPSPVKQHLNNYKDIENRLMTTIMGTLGSTWPLSDEVKDMDATMLKNEARQLLPSKGESWVNSYPTNHECFAEVYCFGPSEAKVIFLDWFFHIKKEIENVAWS